MKKVLSLAAVAILGLGVISASAGDIIVSSGPAEKSFIKMGDNLVAAVGTPNIKNLSTNETIER